MAIWSLILALAPLVIGAVVRIATGSTSDTLYLLVGLVAIGSVLASVVLGIIAIRRVKRSEGTLKGIGLVTGGFGVVAVFVVASTIGVADRSDELFRDDFEGTENFWAGEDAMVSETYQQGATRS